VALTGRIEAVDVTAVTDSSLDWDWDSFKVDAPPPSMLDPYGELQPMAVDPSLTSLLFTSSSTGTSVERAELAPAAPIERPAFERFVPETSADVQGAAELQGALFETV
jgi:hypothetical protein